jgi:capsular polysaccharide biosynthesis protein
MTAVEPSKEQELTERIAFFLRRARHDRLVSWYDVSSCSDLLNERRPSILWLREPAALPPAPPMLFDELANDEVRREHVRVETMPGGVGIACLHDVLVSGYSLVGTSSAIYRLGPVAPLYVDEHLSRDLLSNDLPVGPRRLTRRTKRAVPGVTVLLTHWNSAVYGHWLLENMPKLLLLRRIASELPAFRIALPQYLPEWLTRWIKLVLPDAVTEVYHHRKEYLHCETLLMPTLLLHPAHYACHPELAVLLSEFCDAVARTRSDGARLYVSRLTPSHYRTLTNQAEIEAIAVSEGLALVKPETLSIADQIAMFRSAQLIVGEFGSAMHNALFSAPGTRVVCLNWINALQSRIAQLKRQEVGYLLPAEGAPIKYVRGASAVSYHIDPDQFRTCLRALI